MLNDAYLNNFFKGIELKGKSLLDVGCGDGSLVLYAYKKGISRGYGIDPNNGETRFQKKVDFQHSQFNDKFDIIVLHDSLNHLNEDACINLRRWYTAWEIYLTIGTKLHKLLNPGGLLVIADASRRNLWHDLHLPNPFDPSIEWHKHQTPETWIELLSECGFGNPKLSWLAPERLLKYRPVVENKLVSYCLVSHFRLVMEAK